MPISVASSTVAMPPRAAAARNPGSAATASGTRPLAEKVWISPAARTVARSEPASCVTVAQPRATRYDTAPDPYSVATPLRLSFAPFHQASSPTPTTTASPIMADLLGRHDNSTGSARVRHRAGSV